MGEVSRPLRAERRLAGLKDFQRRTVDYVFDRLYGSGGVSRFLVADEVGLGKTMVARGIIAKSIEHLQAENRNKRIDILYVCSNAAIAKQNISRLQMAGYGEVALSTRLTYLPTQGTLAEQKPGELPEPDAGNRVRVHPQPRRPRPRAGDYLSHTP